MNSSDLCFTSAMDLAREYRAGTLSPVEVVDAILDRIDGLNSVLNAFLTITPDRAREEARAAELRFRQKTSIGPLDGIPYSLKDLEHTAGIRTTFGSKWFADHVPLVDGYLPSRLKKTGAVLLGKTNTSNFG